jgi:hypothetical protein
MKKEITKKGPLRTSEEAKEQWKYALEALLQEMIKKWVE